MSAAFVLGFLPNHSPATHVELTTSPAASGSWLNRLNQWRSNAGVPSLSENPTWSAGDASHALYMVKNDLVTHYESVGVPYYTAAGDTAARNSNIQVSSSTGTSDTQAIDWWMGAPFHALGMMDPRLSQTGFGSYREVKSGWQEGAAVDTLRGNSFSGGQYPVYFPGNGTTEPLTNYSGYEFPDPLQACPGYSLPTGLPVFVQVGGNVATSASAVHSFTGNGVALAHCVIDSSSPSVGSNLTYRGGVIVIPRQPLQNGVRYVVALTVNGAPYTWSFTVGPFTACSSVTSSAAPSSPSVPGTSVAFTASGAGCPSPLYEFWILAPGGSWTVAQAYSTSATFNWNTTGQGPGAYRFSVWVRDAGSGGTSCNSLGCSDAFVPGFAYTITGACTSVTASASPASPQTAGTAVTVTASAASCANPRYEFWIKPPAGSWTVAQGYSASATFSWNTTGLPGGTYSYSVWARDNTSGAGYDAYFPGTAYTLTTTACTSVAASAAPASPQASGTTITISATSTGCANPRYEFWLQAPGGSWTIAQSYSGNATFSWSTTGSMAGAWHYSVWVRDATSAASYDAYFPGTAFTLTPTACTSANASVTPASPQVHGTTITFTAASASCAHPLYEFWIKAPGGSWTIAQPYSSSATFNWSTTGLAPGTYSYSVWVRDSGRSAAYDTYFPGTAYTLT
jgi:hypothetical protein